VQWHQTCPSRVRSDIVPLHMFVRFRQARRLQVSLIETRRIAGKVHHEHVASLGAVDVPPTVADRVAFWRSLHERLSRLANRLDAVAQGKILGQVHARIPMVTIDDLRALQSENTDADEQFWTTMRELHQSTADDHKQLAAAVARTIATAEAAAKMAGDNAEAAKERAARLKRGDDVPGALGKPPDMHTLFREAGWTEADLDRCRMIATIGEIGGFEELMAETHKAMERARQAVVRRVLVRRLRLAGIDPAC
jgi:hypothetical protein